MAESKSCSVDIDIAVIPSVSPSLAETIRNCPLQAALSRNPSADEFTVGNPKAWLGIAFHEVLEKLWSPALQKLTNDELVNELWESSIDRLRAKAINHPLNKRFASPEHWPGYHLTRATVQLTAQRALAERPRTPTRVIPTSSLEKASTVRERALAAMGGKLIGKPDAFTSEEVIDFKSGSVFDESTDGTQLLNPAYVRQLRLYGYLIYENTGNCPTTGKLWPMRGEIVAIDLDPDRCQKEADEALALLDGFNSRLSEIDDVAALATPSPNACKWCQFKTICPAFWASVNETWADDLGTAAVEGFLTEDPTPIHNDRSVSLSIRVTRGTHICDPLVVAPLERCTHNFNDLQDGDLLRVTNLYQRNNGQLSPTSLSHCVRVEDCPSIRIPTA